jgi:hypothetical protein
MVGEEIEMKPSFAGLLILSSVIASSSFAVAAPRPTAAALIRHFAMAQIPREGPWFTRP